jgi:hypothetical protein
MSLNICGTGEKRGKKPLSGEWENMTKITQKIDMLSGRHFVLYGTIFALVPKFSTLEYLK